MDNQTDEFLQLYKKLEFEGRRIYFPDAKENESIIGRLFNIPQLKKYKEDLDYCRVVRNFLTHNPKVNGVYPIVPSVEMINLLKHCVQVVVSPPKAIDFAIPFQKMYTATLDSKASEVIKTMNMYTYTHVPIIENNRVFGIFSDNTVFTYMCSEMSLSIDENTTIRKFQKYLPFDEHLNEYFVFLPKSSYFYEIQDLFKYTQTRKKLLSVIYITPNGRRDEPLLGMITPWDII